MLFYLFCTFTQLLTSVNRQVTVTCRVTVKVNQAVMIQEEGYVLLLIPNRVFSFFLLTKKQFG